MNEATGSGTLIINFPNGYLHLAIGHAFVTYSVTTDADGKKHLNVMVSDYYVFENDYGLYYSTPKGWLINQWARTEQGCGAINPFTWWIASTSYELR